MAVDNHECVHVVYDHWDEEFDVGKTPHMKVSFLFGYKNHCPLCGPGWEYVMEQLTAELRGWA